MSIRIKIHNYHTSSGSFSSRGASSGNDKFHIYIFLTYPDHFSTILS
nr:MAG TPA: hypothetical protein [Caudoviricetes sp.]